MQKKKFDTKMFSDLELKYYQTLNSHLSWGRIEGEDARDLQKRSISQREEPVGRA